jgi:DNA-directed RNA polymerase alpha subunit
MKKLIFPDKFLTDCEMSIRCINTLKANNIHTVNTLCSKTLKELLLIRNMSSKTMEEIDEFIKSFIPNY